MKRILTVTGLLLLALALAVPATAQEKSADEVTKELATPTTRWAV